MKKLFIFAASAALFAACSQSDELALNTPQVQAQVEETPVAFGIYVGKGTTRAGAAGDVSTDNLGAGTSTGPTGDKGKNGFGVFAYYTNDEQYAGYTMPDFMYNQQVTSNAEVETDAWKVKSLDWSYSPVKYWPNEFGTDAVSNSVDYLSFFAYAPWVEVDPTTGLPTVEKDKNIVALTKNTTTGDPMVRYKATLDPSNAVDLLWGVIPTSTDYTPIQELYGGTVGKPYINLIKEKGADGTKGKVNFNFLHALAKLRLRVIADVDKKTPVDDAQTADDNNFLPYIDQNTGIAAATDDKTTRIWVRSITLTGFNTEGTLNLNNRTALEPFWLSFDGKTQLPTGTSITLNDGRQDGSEAISANANETLPILNPAITESGDGIANAGYVTSLKFPIITTAIGGVTNTPKYVFAGSTDANKGYAYVIPNGDAVTVTIVYDVETIDENLPGYLSDGVTHGSVVENKITKTVKADGSTAIIKDKLKAGKQYTLDLHLGMTSVKLSASVADWDSDESENVNLPINDDVTP